MIKHKILIYAGFGTCTRAVTNTRDTLQNILLNNYEVTSVGPKHVRDPVWLQDTALLVMPGGTAGTYMKSLAGKGNENISAYVQNGGKFLGICAGAYYASARVEFAKGDPKFEVMAERDLKFFPGAAVGPIYSGFGYDDLRGVRAAKISWQQDSYFKPNQEFKVFYHGGGSFSGASDFDNVKVLANYCPEKHNDDSSHPAIVECEVGKGKAILSGVHFEWNPQDRYRQDKLQKIQHELQSEDENRLALAKHLLARLGL